MNKRDAARRASHIATFRDANGNLIPPGSPDDRRILAALGEIVARLDAR